MIIKSLLTVLSLILALGLSATTTSTMAQEVMTDDQMNSNATQGGSAAIAQQGNDGADYSNDGADYSNDGADYSNK